MCNCFKETLDKVKEHIKPQLPEKHSDLKVDWEGYSFILSGKPYIPVNPKINIEYRGFKKNGDPKSNLTKETMSIMARYCPFCGEDTEAVTKDDYKALQLEWESIEFNPDSLDLDNRMSEIEKIMSSSPWTFNNDTGDVVEKVENNPAVAAIEYALNDNDMSDCIDFLRYWNEGEFNVIRENWSNVPDAVFIGADSQFKPGE